MSELPAALVAVLRASAAKEAPSELIVSSAHVRRGDLRFVRALSPGQVEPRLALVLSVDSGGGFAEVLLAHPYPEMACEIDAVVPREVSGAPYRLVVQTDLRGVIWTYQFGSAVGSLDADALHEVGRVTSEGDVVGGAGIHCGLRLAGVVDPRWEFKSDEGSALRALARDCTEALLDEGAWEVEPGLLRPELLELADDPATLVAELVHWVKTRSLAISADEIETLLDLGALELEAWASVSDLGIDIWTSIQALVESSATTPRSRESGDPIRVVTATHVEVRAWSEEPDVVHFLGRREPAAT